VLAIVRSAAKAGAVVANYCEARELVLRDGTVAAVRVRDLVRNQDLEVRARVVVNATGPFAPSLARRFGGQGQLNVPLSRDMAFVVRRELDPDMAAAVQTRYRDPDAVLSRGNRHLFMAPWRPGYTLIGVNSRVYTEDAYDLQVTEPEIADFLDEINEACPPLRLRRDEIAVVNAGLLPFGDNEPDRKDLSFGKRSQVVDHALSGGPRNLISAMSVRWTMGRLTGERVVDLVAAKLGGKTRPSVTAASRVWGGDMESVADCTRDIRRQLPAAVSDAQATRLFRHYGTDWQAVAGARPLPGPVVAGTDYFEAEVRHAVRQELAVTLADVVMRRLDLGTADCPPEAVLAACAVITGSELGWDSGRREREVAGVRASYPFASPRSQLPANTL